MMTERRREVCLYVREVRQSILRTAPSLLRKIIGYTGKHTQVDGNIEELMKEPMGVRGNLSSPLPGSW